LFQEQPPHGVDIQYSGTAAQEVAGIVIGMEPDQVALQHARQDLIAYWEDSVDLAGWEWRVQEEAKFDILLLGSNQISQQGREQHQVVVMNPDHIVVLDIGGNGFGKKPVGFLICVPSFVVKGDFARMIMKQWPQNRVYNN
jgi:hypothetical protein